MLMDLYFIKNYIFNRCGGVVCLLLSLRTDFHASLTVIEKYNKDDNITFAEIITVKKKKNKHS